MVVRIVLIVVLLLCLLLVGCSPDYNWRTVGVADGMVNAIFPDKPQVQQKTLSFAGHELEFSLTATTVNGAVFAIGYALLPETLKSNEAARNEMAKTVIQSFYRNLGLKVPDQLPALGTPFDLVGQSPKGAVKLRATVSLAPYALVEGIVTASADSFPDQQANEFLNSLKMGDR